MNATHCKNCKTLLQKDEKPAEPAEKRSDFKALPDKVKARLRQAFDDVDGDADALRPRLAELAKQADCDEAVVTQFFADRRGHLKQKRKRKAVTDKPEAALAVLQQAFDDVDGDADALRPRLAELAKQADCDEAVVTQFFADRRGHLKQKRNSREWHSVQRIKRVTEKTAEATAVYKNLVQAC